MPMALLQQPQIRLPRMMLYGVGYVSNSLKTRSLTTFLMVFYSQVMGLPAAWVGLGAGIALVFDALVDPAVGYISDQTRTRWGRRHPFMYAAALPVGLLFYLLWNPPSGLQPEYLFTYMMVCLLLIRLFDTFFELPSSALIPELIEDYDKRTTMISLRILMGVVGSMLMMVFAYQIALAENADGTGGILDRDGYFLFGLVGGLVIVATITTATLSTHRYIPWLKQQMTFDRPVISRSRLLDIKETLIRRSFITIGIAGMMVAFAGSLTLGLTLYISLFFWEFTQGQLAILAIVVGASAIVGAGSATFFSRKFGKKRAAIGGYIVGALAEMIPYGLKFAGLMPENGDPAVFTIVATGNFLTWSSWTMTGTFISALLADIVEESALTTGKRTAGLLFAADSLFKKVSSAGGPAVAGLLLSAVAFPVQAEPGEIPEAVLTDLMINYIGVLLVIYVVSIAILSAYNITRESHAANVAALRERAAAEEATG